MYNTLNNMPEHHHPMGKYVLPEPYPEINVSAKNPFYAGLLLDDYASQKSELNAINQYFYHHLRFKDVGLQDIAELVVAISITEMHHLEMIGELILKLGGDPRFRGFQNNNNQYYSGEYVYYGNHVLEMLSADIEAEKGAIQQYRRHVDQIQDPFIKAILNRIIMDEEYHLKLFMEAYRKYSAKS
ncbi:ferritin-like domain-containing protein [Heliophilum fasciatum]|uniref:Bacterioferritin n=1 Tax=Heliophilum fasciatum TaxID=35700 RepID=A0A4R2RMV8_9FIRM|nr:ferritin-like domain-containing protein [Heliophilum fasciatum]MCW2278496.1 bacterioferritin [Heliophilum fasciatum]TCP63627.1 bacterioferritin [Heliophilum fasciatum]